MTGPSDSAASMEQWTWVQAHPGSRVFAGAAQPGTTAFFSGHPGRSEAESRDLRPAGTEVVGSRPTTTQHGRLILRDTASRFLRMRTYLSYILPHPEEGEARLEGPSCFISLAPDA